MVSPSRRRLWTAVTMLLAVGVSVWVLRSPGPEPAPADGDRPATRDANGDANGHVDTAAAPGGHDLDLSGLDLGEGFDLAGEFEAPETRQVHRYELLLDGRSVGSFRAEVARGQEGMIELRFRLQTEAGTDRGSVTTVSRLFYRYARLAVEAESESPLPLLTVLAPPALEAVLTMLEGPPAGGGAEAGAAVTVDGTAGRRFSTTLEGGDRIETVVVPGRLLPLRVRTTLADGTVLEASPP